MNNYEASAGCGDCYDGWILLENLRGVICPTCHGSGEVGSCPEGAPRVGDLCRPVAEQWTYEEIEAVKHLDQTFDDDVPW